MIRSRAQLVLLLLATVSLNLAVICAAEPIPGGSSSFRFVDQRGNADKPLTIWTHAPQKLRDRTPIVFVLHGVRRNGQEYRDQWREQADKGGFLLVVPEFPESSYSNEAYQRGNMFDEDGRPVEPAKWTFSAIEHLFDHTRNPLATKVIRITCMGIRPVARWCSDWCCFCPQRAIAVPLLQIPATTRCPTRLTILTA